jgi:hypothetical protein
MVGRAHLAVIGMLVACVREPTDPVAVPTAAPAPTPAPSLPPVEPPVAKPEPAAPVEKKVGCWEREFGKPPAAAASGRSLPEPIAGCEGCETMRVGPNAAGLHVEVLRRVHAVIESLPAPEIDEPVMWINSGRRDGDPDDSMHNQGLAIDAVICGLDTRGTGERLRKAGFTCVIEYYDGAGNPCHFAHADLRTHPAAVGAYAKDGRKARTCPKRAKSKTMDCGGSKKRDWTYSEG